MEEGVSVLLKILRQGNVAATFFVLGVVAEQSPGLVKRIQEEGHEIATHGFGHDPLWKLGREGFRRDLERAVTAIARVTGREPIGYRAPAFSVGKGMDWVFEELSAMGFRYDSSVFPIWHRRYGIPGAPRFPHWVPGANGSLFEFPLATWRFLGLNLPAAGGGYLRLFPVGWIRRAIKQMNRLGQPAVLYLHPYEFDPSPLRIAARRHPEVSSLRISRTEFLQNLKRSGVAEKLRRLLDSFSFRPLESLVPGSNSAPFRQEDLIRR